MSTRSHAGGSSLRSHARSASIPGDPSRKRTGMSSPSPPGQRFSDTRTRTAACGSAAPIDATARTRGRNEKGREHEASRRCAVASSAGSVLRRRDDACLSRGPGAARPAPAHGVAPRARHRPDRHRTRRTGRDRSRARLPGLPWRPTRACLRRRRRRAARRLRRRRAAAASLHRPGPLPPASP